MFGLFKKKEQNPQENRMHMNLNWDNNIELILKQLASLLNDKLKGSDYYVERNSTIGEKNLDLFKQGNPKRVGHIWPKKREQVMHASFTNDIVRQLACRIEMPQDCDVKKGRNLDWRQYRNLSLDMLIEMISELATIDE